MVAIATTAEITSAQERAIYDELYNRGALTPAEVADLVGSDRAATEQWLADRAFVHVLEFDPRFGRYVIE
jgi:hypothetical protein